MKLGISSIKLDKVTSSSGQRAMAEHRDLRMRSAVIPSSCCSHVCARVQMNRAWSYTLDSEAPASLTIFPFLISTLLTRETQSCSDQENIGRCYVTEEAHPQKLPNPGKMSLAQNEPHTPHVHRNHLCGAPWEATQLPGEEGGSGSGIFCSSPVNLLCAHFPFPSLLQSATALASRIFTRVGPMPLAYSFGNLPTRLSVRALASWGVDSKGDTKTQNSKLEKRPHTGDSRPFPFQALQCQIPS